nr:Mur ligase family protein [Curtobacterium flaccumfaciens]
MRFFIPILIGRILRALARARGGGSAYPGYIVLKLVPDFLQHVTKQFPNGVVFVLGSNGKSTTTHMISDIVRAHGLRVFTNPSGANLPQGIASALLSEVSLTGRLKADIGILEVDEAFAVELAGILSPSTVTMLNVQVDQLYRFFETERVATMMLDTAALSTANVITNHDDQFLDGYSGTPGQRVLRFGASDEVIAAAPNGLQNADSFDAGDRAQHTADAGRGPHWRRRDDPFRRRRDPGPAARPRPALRGRRRCGHRDGQCGPRRAVPCRRRDQGLRHDEARLRPRRASADRG